MAEENTEQKPQKMFKGTDIEVQTINSKGQPYQVELKNTKIPPLKGAWWEQKEQKLPRLMILTNHSDSSLGTDYRYLAYFDHKSGKLNDLHVPKNLKVRLLTGKQGRDMVIKYREFQIGDLDQKVQGSMQIGCDPRIFVVNEKNEPIPAFNYIKDKKTSAVRSPNHSGQGNHPLFNDGYAAKITTKNTSCLGFQVDAIQAGLQGIFETARLTNKKAELTIKNVVEFSNNIPINEENSSNLYGLKPLFGKDKETNLQFARGDIHFGIGVVNEETAKKIVRALDSVLGVFCVSLFANLDNPVRRQYTGMAGQYRIVPHGLEYRVLSNAWLCHPMITNMVIDFARHVVWFGKADLQSLWEATEQETVETIQNHDVKKAREILLRNEHIVRKLFKASYGFYNGENNSDHLSALFNLAMNGVESFIKDPTDLTKNWDLKGKWNSHSDGKDKNVRRALPLLIKGEKI